MTEVRLLGPVEIWVEKTAWDVGPPQRRATLAALAADAGRPVSPDALVHRVWGEDHPDTARRALHAHITRLRRVFEQAGQHGEKVRLIRRSGGYVLDIAADRVDLLRFRGLVDRAHEPGRADAEAAALLWQALTLWRDEPLTGLTGEWADRLRQSWWRRYLDAATAWGQAELRMGNHEAVTATLVDLVNAHRLHEPLVTTLLRALHAGGCTAEALDLYAKVRVTLRDELGADPGVELQRAYLTVLRGNGSPPPWPPKPGTVPKQLPLDVSAFVGRADEVARLDALLGERVGPSTTVVISAVSGTAGVGKTALAVHWAHRVVDHFEDGQLYVDLRGYDPGRPVESADALAGLLAGLGVDGDEIPGPLPQRAARYRSELSDRRMLIVLDNASTAEQVRPLLPGTPSCLVVITSRDSLSGLVAREGAVRIDLDVLPQPEALALLRTLVGGIVDAEPAAAQALVRLCAQLPLALRVAAELVAARPDTPLAALVNELDDEAGRLDLLRAGDDERSDVRAVLSWSYRHLPPPAAEAFRLLGLHPARDVDAYAVAALTKGGADEAQRLLSQLVQAHLVHPTGPGRFGMHDLIRAYAVECAAVETPPRREELLNRLYDYYLACAAAAMDTLYPAERRYRPRVDPPDTVTPPLTDETAATRWLDAERAAIIDCAVADGFPEHTVRLSAVLWRYLEAGGHHDQAQALHNQALAAAWRLGDRAGAAHALTSLGTMHWRQGRYPDALDRYEQASALFRQVADQLGAARVASNLGIVYMLQSRYEDAAAQHRRSLVTYRAVGDHPGEARALGNLGQVCAHLGLHREATEYYEQALTLFRATGDRHGEARSLNNLGTIHEQFACYEQAAHEYRRAVDVFQAIGDRTDEAIGLVNLGEVHYRLGDTETAARHLDAGLALARELGDRWGEACAVDRLGLVRCREGRYEQAIGCHQQALDLCRELGERNGEISALNGLGEALLGATRPSEARTCHERALALAADVGERYEQARALDGLARAHLASHDVRAAGHAWQRALDLHLELGLPAADDIRANLAALDAGSVH